METLFRQLTSSNRDEASEAFHKLNALTAEKVDWAYELWDVLVRDLSHSDNRRRSHASQLLCNLAKSDPDGKILKVMPALIEVTKDERFVTARHCLLSLWEIALAGAPQKELLLSSLSERYRTCAGEKNGTLIRYDIVESLRKLYDRDGDEAVRRLALELIESEEDPKYRKKYASVWKK